MKSRSVFIPHGYTLFVLHVCNAHLPILSNAIYSLAALRVNQLLLFTWDWRNDEVVCGQPETAAEEHADVGCSRKGGT